jgi:ferredoxin
VEASRCVGCGICEHRCPVGEQAAIRVSSVGETRDPLNRMLLGS